MALPPLLSLKGSKGASLHLLDPALSSDTLTAQGYISAARLRKGRIWRHEGRRYKLLQGLEPGTRVRPLSLSEPIVLEAA